MKLLKILIILLLLIKGFTQILICKDDPTVFLALKLNPLSENYNYINYLSHNSYYVLFSDENEMIGQNIIDMIYKIPLILYISVLLILFFLKHKNTKEKTL
ncbi:hypothetical protein [Gilliamella sp. ESL0441]|uniref:hypothetical protein n=1 Tax=unclassified Gilliamella TaxID=2685620 RepID=UPI001C69FFAB|nr:hypothetical protein [Gilliamella sp. ESL0441]QYN45100.1 hypothetical protein GYM75_09725 [Gilliamella sp. ESL0441]